MCDKGWITFTMIESQDTPIAYHFGFIYRNVFVVYKPVYNPLLARRSPGQVLIKELLEHAVERKYDEFDFTVGGEAYKHRFASEVRYNTTYRLFQGKVQLANLRLRTGLKSMLVTNTWGRRFLALKKRLTSRHLPRLRETIETHGVVGWLRRATGIFFRTHIYKHSRVLFFEMPPGTIAETNEPGSGDVIFRRAGLSDLAGFGFPKSPVLKAEFALTWRKRLEEGDECFIAEVKGEVASMVWIRIRDHVRIAEADTVVPAGDCPVCLYDGWTLPEFRGKNLLPYIMARVIEMHKDERKVTYLYDTNRASMRVVLKLGGFQVTAVYHLLNVIGIKRRWSKPYTGPQPTS
jgi:hypothetical protein